MLKYESIKKPGTFLITNKVLNENNKYLVTENNVDREISDATLRRWYKFVGEFDEESSLQRANLHILSLNGKDLKVWAKELDMPYNTLYDRVNRMGWSIEKAITTPVRPRKKKEIA